MIFAISQTFQLWRANWRYTPKVLSLILRFGSKRHVEDSAGARLAAGEQGPGRATGEQGPTPATLGMSTLLKAGESVFQPFLWTKTVFHALRGAQPLFHALFGVKTLSGALFAPPLKKPGYGTRRAGGGSCTRSAHREAPRRRRRGRLPAEAVCTVCQLLCVHTAYAEVQWT